MLVSRLPEISQRLRREVPPAAREAIEQAIIPRARARVHPVSGELARSIHAVPNEIADTSQIWIVADAEAPGPKRRRTGYTPAAGVRGAPYAKFVEFGHGIAGGHGHVPPHPFMVPALEESRKQLIVEVAGLVNEVCR